MANNKVLVEFQIVQKGKNISVIQKETDKLAKSTDKSTKSTDKNTKSTDKYNRVAKGGAQISSNQTKNFSKMQQAVDGGGSGGLVRAYALLAANVFALTAAFGVLSRSAQIETLTESIERLEVVSGKSIKSVARDLQEASGFSLDFASSLRSTSLALSAGFDSSQIKELGEVAKNAAVSLGRPLADSLDRIFRGVIKVEPELLDEIGLFVRVDEAASKYADSLGIAAAELTEFQRRTAFANEAIDQGKKKFQDFAEVNPDAFAQLGAAFMDLAQEGLTLVNSVLVPIVQYLDENRGLLIGLFVAIGASILKSIVPAMGQFRQSARKAAVDAKKDFADFKEELKDNAKFQKENAIATQETALRTSSSNLKIAESNTKKTRSYQSESKSLTEANAQLKSASTLSERKIAIDKKIVALEKSKATAKGTNKTIIKNNIAALEAESLAIQQVIADETQLDIVRNSDLVTVTPQKGSFYDLEEMRLQRVELRALALENVSTVASTEGVSKAFQRLKLEMAGLPPVAGAASGALTAMSRASFFLTGSLTILSVKISEVMLKLAPFMPLIMILVVAFPLLLKLMGFGGKAAEDYSAALDKTSEMLENFSEKMENANKTLQDQESTMEARVEAQIAFRRSIGETTEALLEQQAAYNVYKAETGEFAKFFGDFAEKGLRKQLKNERALIADILFNLEGIGKSGESLLGEAFTESEFNQVKALNEEKKTIEATLKATRDEMENIVGELSRSNGDLTGKEVRELAFRRKDLLRLETKELEKQEKVRRSMFKLAKNGLGLVTEEGNLYTRLTKQQTEGADALESAESAVDGAIDSARAFKKQFITKSDVDKPLASFRQITAALALQNDKGEKSKLLEEDRLMLLNRIKEDKNDIITLMTKENQELFKNAETEEDKLKVLLNQRELYAEARVTQIATKNLLNEIKQIEKAIANIRKETVVGIEKSFSLQKQERNLKLELQKAQLDNNLIAANLTKEEAQRLSTLEVNAELMKEIVALGGKEGEGLTAILKTRELNLALIQAEIDEKTESERKEIEILNLSLKRLSAQEKLNASILEGSKINRQIGSFGEGRSSTLSNTRSQELAIEGERIRLKTAEKRAKIEKDLIKAQYAILKTELAVLNEKKAFAGIQGFNFEETIRTLNNAEATLIKSIDQGLENAADNFILTLITGFEKGFSGINTELGEGAASNEGLSAFIDQLTLGETTLSKLQENKKKLIKEQEDLTQKLRDLNPFNPASGARGQIIVEDLTSVEQKLRKIDFAIQAMQIDLATAALERFANQVSKLGAGGELAATLAQFSGAMLESFTALGIVLETEGSSKVDKFVAAANAMATVIAGFSAVLQADTKRRIENIDQAIEAEKRLDGKSAESVQKIKEMEAKKESIARKSFETNKKLQIAQAIISTASGAAAALAVPFVGPALAAMITALGMAQVALIRKTQYQSTSVDMPSANTALTIGKRSTDVDVSQRATAGELNYLRGGRTDGTNLGGAGAAMGRKGYANGGEGIIVGERGPEVITPSAPIDITPNFALGGGETNVNFTINAVDAAGVEDILINQRGNLIRMIREAANENGEEFLPTIDPMAYGSKT